MMKSTRTKILGAVMLLAVLASVFWWGGNAPGLRGWRIEPRGAAVSAQLPAPKASAETPEIPLETPKVPAAAPAKSPAQPVPAASSPKTPLPRKESVSPPKTNARPNETDGSLSAAEKAALAAKTAGNAAASKGDAAYAAEHGMTLDPTTGKDPYLTDPVPAGKPVPVEPETAVTTDVARTCTLSIRCDTILQNMDWLAPEKSALVPEDGIIFPATQVTFYEGESVFNVLRRETKQNKIHMEFVNTPIYNSAYIEGIHNLYEFDCGELSGWMYKVNDWFPNYGCSRYQLQQGDRVEWVYTCNLGADVGGYVAAGS